MNGEDWALDKGENAIIDILPNNNLASLGLVSLIRFVSRQI